MGGRGISLLFSGFEQISSIQEIDRKLENYQPGSMVVVTGVKRNQADGGILVQIFSVESFIPEEVGHLSTLASEYSHFQVLPFIPRLEHFARRTIKESQTQ